MDSLAEQRLFSLFLLGTMVQERREVEAEVATIEQKYGETVARLTPMNLQAITNVVAREWQKRYPLDEGESLDDNAINNVHFEKMKQELRAKKPRE